MFHQVTLQELSKTIVDGRDACSLFGAPRWLALWKQLGATPLYFHFSDTSSNAKSSTGVWFSASRFGSAYLSRIQAHLDGLPGLLLTPESRASATQERSVSNDLRDMALDALRRNAGLYAHWVDYYHQFSSEELPDGWCAQEIVTQRITLGEREGAMRDSVKRSVKRHIASGKRSGAMVRIAATEHDALATYNLAEKTHERHGRARGYPIEMYYDLLRLSQEDDRIIWYVCEHDGRIIGAHIALHECDTALSWAPYMDRAFAELKPAYVLMDAVISAARERGAVYVNLGATPAGAPGVERFKAGFGAEPYRYNVFIYRSLLAKALGKGALS